MKCSFSKNSFFFCWNMLWYLVVIVIVLFSGARIRKLDTYPPLQLCKMWLYISKQWMKERTKLILHLMICWWLMTGSMHALSEMFCSCMIIIVSVCLIWKKLFEVKILYLTRQWTSMTKRKVCTSTIWQHGQALNITLA